MIGLQLQDKGADGVYAVVAQAPGGRYVIQRQDAYEQPFEASAGELETRFRVEVPEPHESEADTEARGWDALASASRDATLRAGHGVDAGPSPEDVFAAVADSEANHG